MTNQREDKKIQLKLSKLGNGETSGYRESGAGNKIILLIHGNMTSSKHWDTFMAKFPEGYKIYAIDLRGFGVSSYCNRIDSLKDFSEDVKLFVDGLMLKDFILAGWSMGGGVSMQFASDYPSHVNKLILLGSVGIAGYPILKKDKTGQPIDGEFLTTREEVEGDTQISPILDAYKTKNKDYLRKLWDTTIYTQQKPSSANYEEYLEAMLAQRNLVDVAYSLTRFNISHRHNGVVDGTGQVDRIIAPTLVIQGDKDYIVPMDDAKEIVDGIGDNAKLAVLKNSGHAPMVDSLDKLISTFIDFAKP